MSHTQSSFGIVTDSAARRITIFDTENLMILHQMSDPELSYTDVAITSDCTRAVLTTGGNNEIAQLDLISEPPFVIQPTTPVGITALDIALTPDDLFAVATDGTGPNPGITSYRLQDRSVVNTIPNLSLIAVDVSPNGNGLVLAVEDNNSVRVLTIGANGMLADTGNSINTGSDPRNITFHPSGNFAFVADFGGNSITVINTTNLTNAATIPTMSPEPQTIVVSKDGTRVFVLTQSRVEEYSFSPSAPYLTFVRSFLHGLSIGSPFGVDQMALDETLEKLFISASGNSTLAAFSSNKESFGIPLGIIEDVARGGVAVCMLQQPPTPTPRSTSTHTCKATVVDSNPVSSGDPIAKVPVLLQEVSVQIPMYAEIDFPGDPATGTEERVLEIKKIKKRTFVTQCRLLNLPSATRGQLFISGFVRKNIQYAANPFVDANGEILSDIKSLTVEVPFDCVANIDNFINPPVGPFLDTRDEFGYLISKPLGTGFPEKDRLTGSDLSQFHQLSSEFYNEIPYCELVQADIIEIDESLDRRPLSTFFPTNIIGEGTFTRLSEKMILDLTLKLLQKQQVRVNAVDADDEGSGLEN